MNKEMLKILLEVKKSRIDFLRYSDKGHLSTEHIKDTSKLSLEIQNLEITLSHA